MRDITHKIHTLRTATATAELWVSDLSLDALRNNSGPKKDIIPTAKAAGYLAVKNTPQAIPLCHPLPVENIDIEVSTEDSGRVLITLTAQTIYKTGCEIEALHGASLVALTMYDMLKPIDKEIEIRNIKLDSKTGGKTDFKYDFQPAKKAVILLISSLVLEGTKDESAAKIVEEKLKSQGMEVIGFEVLPDEVEAIQRKIREESANSPDLIVTVGGTGIRPTDFTPEAIKPLLEKEIPGIAEAARAYGQTRTPFAMMSRSFGGLIGRTLVLAVPGSKRGSEETMNALFPAIMNVFKVMDKSHP